MRKKSILKKKIIPKKKSVFKEKPPQKPSKLKQYKDRFMFHYNRSKRFRKISIAAALVFGVLFIMVISFLTVHIGNARKVTAAISKEPDTLDPTFCADAETETILVNCFEGLMKIDESGKPVKAAASDYTVSADGLVYTFTISSESKWSDGEMVKASDFVYAWRRTANPYNSSAYADYFSNIVGYDKILEDFDKEQQELKDEQGNDIKINMSDLWVKAAGGNTLVVKLKEKDPSFLYKCASAAFLPLYEENVRPFSRIWSTDKERFYSNGAFKLSSWMEGSYLELSPNPHYREAEKVKLKYMKFIFTEDGDEAKKMFDKSTILFSTVLPEKNLEKVTTEEAFVSYESMGTYFLYFNLTQKPFDDVRVRQALTLAIDREKLIEETASVRGTAASTLISNGFNDFRQSGESLFDATSSDSNIEKAKALLKEAGYENGEGFPGFEYLFNDNTYSRETAEILRKMWKENLGINCTLQSVSWQKLDDMRKDGSFTVAKGGIIAPYNDVSLMLEGFTTENNFCAWSNKEYDNLVSQTINAQGENKISLAHKAEKILLNEWVVCPLYYYTEGYLASDRIENYYVTSSGIAYFVNAEVGVF